MPTQYSLIKEELRAKPKTWLVTGVAGFIGSNILESLLKLNQTVVGLDNFSTGSQYNIDQAIEDSGVKGDAKFTFIEGDIRDLSVCKKVCLGVDYVLHQAALGSVPRSIADPITTNDVNISGFLNMLVAANEAKVGRFVYAASSSTYGDHEALPKVEDRIGNPLSPYAVTKFVNELYAKVFADIYGVSSIGLRYFNVFGKRQDPNGAYAAVIPKWVAGILNNEDIIINGDGQTSRDFCYVANAVQMNIIAATATNPEAANNVYNTALGERTSLNELFDMIKSKVESNNSEIKAKKPIFREFRAGDVMHSLADITKAKELLGYSPTHKIDAGMDDAIKWYMDNLV